MDKEVTFMNESMKQKKRR